MTVNKLCFKDYITCVDDRKLSKTRKRMNKKSPKGRYYGGAEDVATGITTESIILELLNGALPGSFSSNVLSKVPNVKDGEEEQETTINKIDLARQLFQSLINRPDMTRKTVIQHFIDHIGVTHSTAVSYYERLAKEAGLTGQDGDSEDLGQGVDMSSDNNQPSSAPVKELPADTDLDLDDTIEEPTEPGRTGIIRTVKNAHLIYKKQSEDGTFEELWVYNTGKDMRDEISIRRDILAGTDIVSPKTKSADGKQEYTLTTLGNAQYVHITGLPN